jgi:hypothetical protein
MRIGGVLMEAVQADDEELEDWLLTSLERGNPATVLDKRHAGMAAWSAGNQVRPLVHGAVYFAELLAGVEGLRAGDADLCDPRSAFAAFARSAALLDAWHAEGRPGPRPPGRLRTYQTPGLSRWTRTWATPLYRCFYDPDGRPPALRRNSAF